MHQIRRSEERGHAEHGWLSAKHSFSFASYFDPEWMGFRNLKVINQDRIQPNQGFGTHPHKNMEILTYIMRGELKHKDSMGNEAIIRPGEIQRMTAGKGVTHSEWNSSSTEVTELLQIWIEPSVTGLDPSYEQVNIESVLESGERTLIASLEGGPNAVKIHQDVDLYLARWKEARSEVVSLKPDRHVWIQVISGSLIANSVQLDAGDAIAFSNETSVSLEGSGICEYLLFDLN
ncbi:MAG: pirin family protein [Bdellovibrionales bacterium]|nr:pirin family protein [Bdellovibrionales bacterium]